MRCVGGVAAALVVAAAISVAERPALAGAEPASHDAARLLLFASTDLWRHGGFVHGGVLWSPAGLDREGYVLKLLFGGGAYRYVSGALGNVDVEGRHWSLAVLPGWRFVRNGLFATVFVGFDFQNHRLSPDDPSAGLRGSYAGVRTGFELWYEPTPSSMLAADASVSSVGPSYSARLAAGWRLHERFYLGPEVQGFAADDNYRQIRAGIHVTGLRVAPLEWSAGLGWANDSDNRGSLYGRLGVLTRQ
jgi:hypothetical protein